MHHTTVTWLGLTIHDAAVTVPVLIVALIVVAFAAPAYVRLALHPEGTE